MTTPAPLDVARIQADFPILKRQVNGKRLVYLDSASSAQKPQSVLDAMDRVYRESYANVHRGVYTIAEEATAAFEAARGKVAGFVHAREPREIVFTRNATESINLVNGKPVVHDDPALFAAAELTRLLRARGVTVGEPTRGVAPEGSTTVASVTSQPLRTIVRWMLLTSNNTTAEMLTKELGARTRGAGTTASGVAAVQAALRELGVPLDGQTMIDGSGLDRENRLTCRILVAVVDLGARADLKVLRDTLPGGGSATPDGKVHAKGGYLTDVTGLAGIVDRDTPLRFAFLANGGVPKNANVDLNAFTGVLNTYQPPAPVPDAVIPSP